MGFLQFNLDGSLKLTDEQAREKEREKSSIIITREQISLRPAKAQLRIKFPERVDNPNRFILLYNNLSREISLPAMHVMNQTDDQTFIVKVEQGSWSMYSVLDSLAYGFKEFLSNRNNVIIKGSWETYNKK